MPANGIKEGFTLPHIYRLHIYVASFQSVLFPFIDLVCLGWDRVTHTLRCSKILKTGLQGLPVDSMQTPLQLYFASQSHSWCNPLVKEEKRACLYSVGFFEPVISIQAKLHVLWTSSPQQLNFKILKDKKPPLDFYCYKTDSDWSSGEIESTSEEIGLQAIVMCHSLMP